MLIEEPLFFTQYRFHRQKLILHRATMMGFTNNHGSRRHRAR
ncbi:MAG: cryptochrome/photolyase family protein, partial [Thermomicrobiales bacterium]